MVNDVGTLAMNECRCKCTRTHVRADRKADGTANSANDVCSDHQRVRVHAAFQEQLLRVGDDALCKHREDLKCRHFETKETIMT